MTVLRKSKNIAIIQATDGVVATPATAYSPGYYTTIKVAKQVLKASLATYVQQDEEEEVTFSSLYKDDINSTGITWRLATYAEIIKAFFSGRYGYTKCEVSKKIISLANQTPYFFSNIARIDSTNYIGLGYAGNASSIISLSGIPKASSVGLFVISNPKRVIVPSSMAIANQIYDPTWNYSDHYSCTEINGVETITYLSGN